MTMVPTINSCIDVILIAQKADDLDTLKKQTVKALLESIPLTMFYIIRSGQNVYSINDVIGSHIYPSVTGDNEGILSEVISKNPRSVELLTRRIGLVTNSIQKSMRSQSPRLLIVCRSHRLPNRPFLHSCLTT